MVRGFAGRLEYRVLAGAVEGVYACEFTLHAWNLSDDDVVQGVGLVLELAKDGAEDVVLGNGAGGSGRRGILHVLAWVGGQVLEHVGVEGRGGSWGSCLGVGHLLQGGAFERGQRVREQLRHDMFH